MVLFPKRASGAFSGLMASAWLCATAGIVGGMPMAAHAEGFGGMRRPPIYAGRVQTEVPVSTARQVDPPADPNEPLFRDLPPPAAGVSATQPQPAEQVSAQKAPSDAAHNKPASRVAKDATAPALRQGVRTAKAPEASSAFPTHKKRIKARAAAASSTKRMARQARAGKGDGRQAMLGKSATNKKLAKKDAGTRVTRTTSQPKARQQQARQRPTLKRDTARHARRAPGVMATRAARRPVTRAATPAATRPSTHVATLQD